MRLSDAVRNLQARIIHDRIAGGTLTISDEQSELAVLPIEAVSPPIAGGVQASIGKAKGLRTGKPVRFTVYAKDGEIVIEGTGAELVLDAEVISAGGDVVIDHFAYVVGGAG